MIMRHIKNCKRPRISQIVKKESWVLHKVPTLEFLKDCLNLWFLSFSASKAKYRYLITSPFSPFHSSNWMSCSLFCSVRIRTSLYSSSIFAFCFDTFSFNFKYDFKSPLLILQTLDYCFSFLVSLLYLIP